MQHAIDNDWKQTNFPEIEKLIIDFWKNNDIVNKLIQKTENYPKKIFVDGPPFATGSMHYGHILVSTVKDTMTRYFTMAGYRVDRSNGFDVHGIPIEMKAKAHIGYKTKSDLMDFGLQAHNNVCRDMVINCKQQWHNDFCRIGRWLDNRYEYTTMDKKYMESVIWIFSQLYSKGMIFEGYKVLPYSTGCNTPLSHFEAKQNYRQVTDTSIVCLFQVINTKYCTFKMRDDYPCYICIWTTTPWTLPSNMAISVNPTTQILHLFDFEYNRYLLMSRVIYESTYLKLLHNKNKRFMIMDIIIAEDLKNMLYKPPFEYFYESNFIDNADTTINSLPFRVLMNLNSKESGEDSGTGFVHNSPAHGEDDFRICALNDIIDTRNSKKNLMNVIDDDGCFTPDVVDFCGLYIKDAEKPIIKYLQQNNLLFDCKPYNHKYPFCYRTNTPLIYKLSTGWFLNASDADFRQQMLAINSQINWMPAWVGENDFANWLQSSVDWCVSRSRYWGTPIPVWKSDDGQEIICIESVAQLQELSGVENITDLHIEYLDAIKIPSKTGRGYLSRVVGVLDCWFESGSAPYSQYNYPFENTDLNFESREYISDFITESKDQIRGWFYTLTVLSTALFNKPAFGNVVVTGILLGNDGNKMSKLLTNYPDPNILIDNVGADTLRFYLLNTPTIKAESSKFDESQIKKLQQNSVVKIFNIVLFAVEKIKLFNSRNSDQVITYPTITELHDVNNILDKWIINKTALLLVKITNEMDAYKINNVTSKLLAYIDQLTSWYLKLGRERLKGGTTINDWQQSLQVLLYILHKFNVLLAPFMPFVTEYIHQKLRKFLPNGSESVHFESYPTIGDFVVHEDLEQKFEFAQKIIIQIRELRDQLKLNNRRPLLSVQVACDSDEWTSNLDIVKYICMECNVLTISDINIADYTYMTCEPNMLELSTHLKNIDMICNMKYVVQFIKQLTNESISTFMKTKTIKITSLNMELPLHVVHIKMHVNCVLENSKLKDDILIIANTDYTTEIHNEYLYRLVHIALQLHRKAMSLKPWDIVDIYYYTNSPQLLEFMAANYEKFVLNNIANLHFTKYSQNMTVYPILNDELFIYAKKLKNE